MAKKITSIIFALFIISVFAFTLVSPDKDVLELENRTAASFPDFNFESFKSKSFVEEMDSYLLDQFPLRSSSILAYQSLHQKEVSGYTVIEGSYGYEFVIIDDEIIVSQLKTQLGNENALAWSNKINEIAQVCKEKEIDVFYTVIPSKAEALSFLLPSELNSVSDEPIYTSICSNLNDNVNIIPLFENFKNISEYELENMYFKTDSHWNFKGAYKGFTMLANSLKEYGFDTNIDSFGYHAEDISDTIGCYWGQYNKALGMKYPPKEEYIKYVPNERAFEDLTLFMLDDGIEVEKPLECVIQTDLNGETAFYSSLTCLQKDYLHFHNDNALNDYKLVVLKDSFYSGIVLDMTLLFKETYVIDSRHYNDLVIEDFLERENFDGILLFYSSTAFDKIDENSVDNLLANFKVRN